MLSPWRITPACEARPRTPIRRTATARLVTNWKRDCKWVETLVAGGCSSGWDGGLRTSTIRDGADRARGARGAGSVVRMKVLRNPVLVAVIQKIGIRTVRFGALRLRFSWTSWGTGSRQHWILKWARAECSSCSGGRGRYETADDHTGEECRRVSARRGPTYVF
jgi:hypothetical protein